MAIDAPSHRQLLGLVNHVHLVDSTVTRDAANSCVNVSGVIEVNKLGKVVNFLPRNTTTGFPAFMDRSEFLAGLVNCCKSRNALSIRRAVAVDTRRRRGHRRVSGIKNGIVAVATVHL